MGHVGRKSVENDCEQIANEFCGLTLLQACCSVSQSAARAGELKRLSKSSVKLAVYLGSNLLGSMDPMTAASGDPEVAVNVVVRDLIAFQDEVTFFGLGDSGLESHFRGRRPPRIWDSGFGTGKAPSSDSGFGIWDLGFGIRDLEIWVDIRLVGFGLV